MPKNYYLILGIPAAATADDVRAAFRRRSKELHPDVSGTGSGPFLELQEAYAVLSDPVRRRDYDRSDDATRVEVRTGRSGPDRMTRRTPTMRRRDGNREISLVDELDQFGLSLAAMVAGMWGGFGLSPRMRSERVGRYIVEVQASPEEARRGGRVQIELPVQVTCADCGGRGYGARVVCPRCAGRGALTLNQTVEVDCPAGLRDGYTLQQELHAFGKRNGELTIVFHVSPQ